MNDKKKRIARIEDQLIGREESMCLVGLVGDPESEKDYERYLASGIQKPFVWIDTGIRRPSLDVSQTTSAEDEK